MLRWRRYGGVFCFDGKRSDGHYGNDDGQYDHQAKGEGGEHGIVGYARCGAGQADEMPEGQPDVEARLPCGCQMDARGVVLACKRKREVDADDLEQRVAHCQSKCITFGKLSDLAATMDEKQRTLFVVG